MIDAPDWTTIEQAYRSSGASTRRLARRYGIAESTLRHRAQASGWEREERVLTRDTVGFDARRQQRTPLQYLLAVINDETAPLDRRCDAAVFAAPYCHPKA